MKNGEFLKHLGFNIRKYRKAKKITIKDLAKACGIKRQSLGLIELGRKNSHILTLKTIADALKVDVKDFI